MARAPRIHLIFDFADRDGGGPLITRAHENTEGIAPDRRLERPPLAEDARAALMRLAEVLTSDTLYEVFSIVIKTHFRWDGGDDFAWDTMTRLASASADPTVLPRIRDLRQYFTLDRTGSKE